MFYGAQQNQNRPTVQPENGGGRRKIQKALAILQLFSGVMIGLFIAGIVAPSFLNSGTATNHTLAVGSLRVLHTLTVGRVIFSYTLQNLGSAILGGLVGSLIALAIDFPTKLAKTCRNLSVFRQVNWKSFLSFPSGRPSPTHR
jgi:hypothetical protein